MHLIIMNITNNVPTDLLPLYNRPRQDIIVAPLEQEFDVSSNSDRV